MYKVNVVILSSSRVGVKVLIEFFRYLKAKNPPYNLNLFLDTTEKIINTITHWVFEPWKAFLLSFHKEMNILPKHNNY